MIGMRSLLTLLVAGLCACTGPAVENTDPASRDRTPQRIVTLNATLTEVVAALGLEQHIVGTDVTSTFPEAVKDLPKLGHDRGIRAEGIISLTPDLVMAGKDQLEPATEAQLRQAGVRLMLFDQVYSIDGTKRLIAQIADSLGKEEGAASLVEQIDVDRAKALPLDPAPKVLFIYARGAGTLLVAGEGTPMQEIITLAGGQNAISGFQQFKPLTPEALVAANPDVVLLFSTGPQDMQGTTSLLKVPGMASTTAGRDTAFLHMDPLVLAGFGPRLGQAIAELNGQLRSIAGR